MKETTKIKKVIRISTEVFLSKAKVLVSDEYIKEGYEHVKTENIKLVWYTKTGANHKAVMTAPKTKKLFEITYIGKDGEVILSNYDRVSKVTCSMEEE